MAIRTIAAQVIRLRAGQSSFAYCFEALFPSLRHCSFIVDAWRPEDFQPNQRELLSRYRVAGIHVGQRIIDIYRGKRFLPTFAFAVPASFGRVFAFAAPPDEAILRASIDGYEIDSGKLAAVAVASFVAFEGTWTFATPEPGLVEVLRAGLPGGAELDRTPASLNFVERSA